MAIELGSAHGKIVIDASGVKAGVNEANAALGKVGGVATKMGAAVAAGMAVVGAALGAASVKMVQMGADAGETASLLATSLGPATEGLNQRLRDFAENANRSFFELQEGSATFVAMTRSMGATQEQAADLSGDFVEMATDLGSFFNVATDDALLDLQGALAGSSETMQKYGIDVRETTLKQMALDQGLITSATDTLPRFVRAQLIAEAVTRQAADAMGDAERTSQSFQNQLRGLQGQVRDAATEIGIKLIPTGERLLAAFRAILPALKQIAAGIFAIFANIVEIGIDFVKSLAEGMGVQFDTLAEDGATWGQNFVVSLAEGMAAAISAVVSVLNQIGQIIANWLAPGSPPKLLPDLPKWGAAAMTEYMEGWREGDFSVFEELTGTIEGLIRSMSANLEETDIIPKILGSRSAIAAAIEQVRETGEVTDDMLSLVVDKAGLAGREVRDYVTALFDVAEADREVIRAQEELNRVTAEYNAILDPLNEELQEIRDRQQDIRDQQELARIQEELASGQLTALEREDLLLRRREIAVRKQIRDTEEQKDTALEGAQATLDAAEKERQEREFRARQLKSLISVQQEQNQLLGDQKEMLENLADAAEDMAKKAKKGAKGAGKALQDMAGMAAGAAGGIGSMADTIATSFDEVFDRVSEKFAPLQGQVEELGQTWARVFNNARNRVEDLRQKFEESDLKKFLDDLGIELIDVAKWAAIAAIGVLALKTAFTVGGWIGAVAAGLGRIAGHIEKIFTLLSGFPGVLGTLGPGLGLLGVSLGLSLVFEDEINRITETINNWLDSTPLKPIEDAFDLSSEEVREIFGNLATQLETIFGLLADKLIEKAQEIWQGIIDWFTNIWNDLVGRSIIPEMIDDILDEFGRLLTDTITHLSDIWTAITTKWEEIKTAVTTTVENLKVELGLKLLALKINIDTHLQNVKTAIETKWGEIKIWLETTITDIKTFIETQLGNIASAIQPVVDLWNGFVDAVKEFWNWIRTHTFNFKINLPSLPDWATPGSPLPIHTAWKDFARWANNMKIQPDVVVPPLLAPQTYAPSATFAIDARGQGMGLVNEIERMIDRKMKEYGYDADRRRRT